MQKLRTPRRLRSMLRPADGFELQHLEPRLLLSTFHPSSSAADGSADSLRAAIIASNSNGEDDVIELGTAEYKLSLAGREEDNAATGDLDIREPGTTLTIRGKGIDLTVINADFLDRVIEVHGDATLILEDLTITHGEVADENGGGLRNLGDVTLRNVKVVSNFQTGTSNQTPRGGGGLNSQGTMLIEGGVIAGNIATGFLGGGGIYNTGNLTIRGGTVINGNQANVDGGGIRIAFRTTHIEDAIIENNTAINDGGGIYIVNDTDVFVTLDRVQILNNDTGGDNGRGGGIRNGGMLTITNSTIEGNNTPGANARGGGIYHENQNANLSIMTSSIIGNTGDTGGGVYITSESTFDITRSTIANNIVGDDGGGLWNGSQSSGTLDNSTVSGNQSKRGGGGIYNFGELTITNTTITNNRADKDGPLNGNVYTGGGGIKGGSDPTLTLHNTIVAGNFSGTGSTAFFLDDIGSDFEAVSSNNVAGDELTTGVNGNQKIGSQNPGLGPLADNGGPTLTHTILPGSFAENAGNPAFTPFKDQRGLPMMGIVDVGAYELQQAFVNPWDYEVMEAGMFGSTNAGYGFGFDDLRRNSDQADPYFLGFKFDTGPLVVGGITNGLVGDRYGAEIKADFAGRLGFEVGFFIDSGDVFTKYDGSLNYLVDDLGGGEFNVSTVFSVADGMLSTVSPKVGAYLDLVLELDADISATGCAVGCVSADIPFKIDESLEIFSLNRQVTDAQGNPMHEADGGPVFDDEVRFAKESIFIETNDGTGEKEAKKYAKAKEKEQQGKISEAFAKDDLAKAKTDEQRDKASQKIKDAQDKQAAARTDQGKAAKQAKKNKKLGQQGITLDFNKADGDLLGFTVGVIGEIGKDKVAARQIPLGGFTVTVPEVELQGADPDFRGTITATTDDITDPVEDAKRQLARLDLDIGGLLGTYAGLPLGKQKVSLGGIVDVEVQTVSYTISPQLNVTQDVASTPYATMVHYDLSRPAEVNLGNGYVTMSSFTIPPEQTFRIKPGDDPIDVTPTLTVANKFTNQIGLDLDLKGALEAFALKIDVLGETLLDIGPLITHNHTLGSFELGNVFDRTFDLAVYDDEGERFEDAEGNPIVYQQPLDGFTIMHAEQDGTSPGTAYRAVRDANNPDLLRVTGVNVQNLGMPVFVAVPLVDTATMMIADTVGVTFAGNSATSAYTLEPEIVIENVVPPGTVTKTPMVDATLWQFNSKSGLDVTHLVDAGVTELIVGFMFNSTGTTNLTFTRSDYQPVSDVPVDNTGDEGVNMAGIEGNSPAAILQSISIDVDGDGAALPLSDGVMVIRYMDGMRGSALINGALGKNATRTSAADIEAYIAEQLGEILDVDDDGSVDAGADGVLIARQLAGFAGQPLTDGAINPQGNRTDPGEIDKFLRGERITASNDAVMSLLRDEDGNLIMEVPGGAGFEVGEIVSRSGGDPFALEPELQPADDAPAGSSAAKPVTAMAGLMVANVGEFAALGAGDESAFDLTMFGDEITYIDLYMADASDPDNASLWQYLGTMAEGSPMPFAEVHGDLMDPVAVREMSQLLRKVERTSVLGVDEPVYVEIPDAAGYEYAALDGYAFDSVQINPDFGGNLLLDREFDLYLMQGGQWVYETTITAGEPYMFAAPVDAFRLFGLALPNAQLHRAANDAAPAVVTTVGFTLDDSGATLGPVPMVMATELEPRMTLTTPDDFAKEVCTGTCGNAFGEPAVLRLVRSGADAELYLNDFGSPVQTYQLSSSTDITVLGDEYKDTLIIDTSGGPLRTPLVFHADQAFIGSDGLVIDGHGVTLNLINRDVVTGVETIDIMGDGANTLIMDLASVQSNAATGNALTILGDSDDTIHVGAGWSFSSIDGQGMHVFTQGGQTLRVSAALAPQVADDTPQPLFASRGVTFESPANATPAFEEVGDASYPVFPQTQSTSDATGSTASLTTNDNTVAAAIVITGDAQIITATLATPLVVTGESFSFDVDYTSMPEMDSTGLSLRMHYDSTKLQFDGLTNVLDQGVFTQQVQSEGTSGIADNDPATDMFINLLWIDAGGNFPGTQPATLFTANFSPVGAEVGQTAINFTGDPAPGFDSVVGAPVNVTVTSEAGPTLSIAGVNVNEGDADQSDAVFVVTLSEVAGDDVTVNYATSDQSATAGEDYEATTGELFIPAGETMGEIHVPVFGDEESEDNETFTVTLSDAAGAVIAVASAVGTIVNDDQPLPTPHVVIDDVTHDEGDSGTTFFTFTVTLNRDPVDAVILALSVSEGTATAADNDLATTGGQLTFMPGGALTQTFTVQVNGDTRVESDETFTVDVALVSGAAIIDDAQGLGTIVNDDAAGVTPRITINDVTMNEGDVGSQFFSFTVTVDRSPIDTITLDVVVVEGTAMNVDGDVAVGGGQVIFSPNGQMTQLVNVQVHGDTKPEDDETFNVELSLASGTAVIDDAVGLGTIVNDDGDPNEPVLLERLGGGPNVRSSFQFMQPDTLNNVFDLRFKGTGFVDILQERDGRLSLALVGADPNATLDVKWFGLGDGMLHTLTSDAGLKSARFKGIGFLGDIQIDGYVGTFEAGDIADQHLIAFGGTPTDKPTKAKFENLTNVTMTSGAPLDLTVVSWTDDDEAVNPDSLAAPSVKKITVKGDRRNNIAALWEADVTLSGAGSPKQTLGAFTAELVREAAFDIAGDVGGITVKGDVSDSAFTVHSALKKFSASGALTNVTMDYDEFGSLAFASWHTGALNAAFGKSLDLKGNKRSNDPGDIVDVDVVLSGITPGITPGSKAKVAIGKIKVAGTASDLTVDVQADNTGSVEVKAATTTSSFVHAAAVKSFKIGNVDNTDVTAGSTGSIDVIRWTGGDIVLTDVKTIKTKGSKTEDGAFTPDTITINQAATSMAKSAIGSASIKGPIGGEWNVTGITGANMNSAAGRISADAIDASFNANFLGDVGSLSSKSFFDGFASAFNFGKIDIKTNMNGATLIAGGSGASNSIGSLKVGGSVLANTVVFVGVDPGIDGVYSPRDAGGDDVFKPGAANSIKTISIKTALSNDSIFQAGLFPTKVKIGPATIDPNDGADDRFIVT